MISTYIMYVVQGNVLHWIRQLNIHCSVIYKKNLYRAVVATTRQVIILIAPDDDVASACTFNLGIVVIFCNRVLGQ